MLILVGIHILALKGIIRREIVNYYCIKKELLRLKTIVAQKGLTIVPLKAYFKGGLAKIEFATAKGKKTYQKKESLKIKDLDREARREMRKK